ncbi:MAG: fatty acid desaturase family protein [Gammaproteobacteria bacterium]|nr:fatty acid desaturase family protein [Gammaproteobacteria bacterium]
MERPTDFLTRTEIARLRTLSSTHATWLIVHCWGVIVAVWVFVAMWTHPLTILLAIPVIGGRQLGLGILGHDGAHHLLYRNRRLNDWVCEWLFNRPLLGASIVAYRNYHLNHHRFTQQANDPDLGLSAPFPITRASFLRKVIRDLTGQTGFAQQRALLRNGFGPHGAALAVRVANGWRRFGPNVAINLVFLAAFAAFGKWYLYFLLWVLPELTWRMLISRIRNIGEHGAVPDNDDRLRNTRTTRAGWLARALIAPYFVNFHLEHHLLVSCPCYRLRTMHRLLIAKGYGPRMELEPSYLAMLRHATSRPATARA